MRLCHLSFIALCIHGASAAVVRKPPAFATPVYSDAYLPASMQMIFHLVDQLKRLAAEEVEQNLLLTPATSPHPPGIRQKEPLPTLPATIGKVDDIQTATVSDEEKYYVPPETYQEQALILVKPQGVNYQKIAGGEVTPEVNHEESEVVYGEPETNFELPEPNHEVPEEADVNLPQLGALSGADEIAENNNGDKSQDESSTCDEFKTSSELVSSDATTSTVDSVVKEIYSIIKTTSLDEKNISSSSEDVQTSPHKSSNNECIQGKNSAGYTTGEKLLDDKERADELKDDKRFTLIGERVDQVPRPSLAAFLRSANATSNPLLRQLSELYDALSKDARRQGFSKYAGYSNEVLQFLRGSAGGGAGAQLKALLEKTVEHKDLTRYDAMSKTKETIGILNNDSSALSTVLRRVLPLPFPA